MTRSLVILVDRFPVRSETFVLEHALGMARRDWSVTVLCHGVGSGITPAELLAIEQAGIGRLQVTPYHPERWRNALSFARDLLREPTGLSALRRRAVFYPGEIMLALRYGRAVERLTPDVLHLHFGSQAAMLGQVGKLPDNAIVTWHGHDANCFPRERGAACYRRLAAADCRHTVGSAFMASRLRQLGFSEASIRRIPMGVDVGTFAFVPRPASRAAESFTVLSVGRLEAVKGHACLIEACAKLLREGVQLQLRIVGAGSLRADLQKQIHNLGLDKAITLPGALDPAAIRKELARADLFALTGIVDPTGQAEGQGLALIEAQATGLPVVATDVGGVASSLRDGETGTLCPPSDVDRIAAAIRKYIEVPGLRLQQGRAARQFVETQFSLHAMLDAFEALYESTQRPLMCPNGRLYLNTAK